MPFSLSHEKRSKQGTLWGIAFSPEIVVDGGSTYQYFATCGGQHAFMYEYHRHEFRPFQRYKSSNTEEDFYAITFAHRRFSHYNEAQLQHFDVQETKRIICVAGAGGDILVIDVDENRIDGTLEGSVSSVFDLKAIDCELNGVRHNLLCSSTKDEVRLWNLDTFANVCLFAGWPDGHFGDVLSVAWHPTGSWIVSGGGDEPSEKNAIPEGSKMKDFQICVWNVLDSPRIREAIQASSDLPKFATERSQFHAHTERFAASVHNDVHSYIVDCVEWLGNLILSKSVHSEILLWKPLVHDDGDYRKSSIVPIKKFPYKKGDVYFVRFALSLNDPDSDKSSFLAVGNSVGEISVWDLKLKTLDDKPVKMASKILRTKKSKTTKPNSLTPIKRSLAFSPDGEALAGCDEGGSVFLWETNKFRKQKSACTAAPKPALERTAVAPKARDSLVPSETDMSPTNRAVSVFKTGSLLTVNATEIVAPSPRRSSSVAGTSRGLKEWKVNPVTPKPTVNCEPSANIDTIDSAKFNDAKARSVVDSEDSPNVGTSDNTKPNGGQTISVAKANPSMIVDTSGNGKLKSAGARFVAKSTSSSTMDTEKSTIPNSAEAKFIADAKRSTKPTDPAQTNSVSKSSSSLNENSKSTKPTPVRVGLLLDKHQSSSGADATKSAASNSENTKSAVSILGAAPWIDLTEATAPSPGTKSNVFASLPKASPCIDLTETTSSNPKAKPAINLSDSACIDLTETQTAKPENTKPNAEHQSSGIIDLTETPARGSQNTKPIPTNRQSKPECPIIDLS